MNHSNYEILIALLPIIILNGITILSWAAFAFVYRKQGATAKVLDRMHPSFLGVFLREWVYWVLNPFLVLFRVLRLTPNMLTGVSLVLGLIAGYFFFTGSFAAAGWIMLAGGALDILDGALARLTGLASKEGAFFDSCVDRYSESLILIGIALYFVSKPDVSIFGEASMVWITALIMLAMMGSLIVSYAKARGESVGFTTNVGIMQRAERVAVLAIAACFYPFFKILLVRGGMDEHWPIIIALIILAVFTNYTAAARTIIIFRDIRRSHGGNE